MVFLTGRPKYGCGQPPGRRLAGRRRGRLGRCAANRRIACMRHRPHRPGRHAHSDDPRPLPDPTVRYRNAGCVVFGRRIPVRGLAAPARGRLGGGCWSSFVWTAGAFTRLVLESGSGRGRGVSVVQAPIREGLALVEAVRGFAVPEVGRRGRRHAPQDAGSTGAGCAVGPIRCF